MEDSSLTPGNSETDAPKNEQCQCQGCTDNYLVKTRLGLKIVTPNNYSYGEKVTFETKTNQKNYLKVTINPEKLRKNNGLKVFRSSKKLLN